MVREARTMEGCVKPVARPITGEHAASSVCSVRRWGQADDRYRCIGITEAAEWTRPVILALVTPGRISSPCLTPVDQARTASAGMNLICQLIECFKPILASFRFRHAPDPITTSPEGAERIDLLLSPRRSIRARNAMASAP